MPIISTLGGGSARGFGLTAGAGFVLADDTNVNLKVAHNGSNSSGTISLVSGYSATIKIYLTGDGTANGPSCCSNCGRSGSGESAVFSVVMGGDETGFSYNFSNGSNQGSDGVLSLTINGGTRNGTIVRAGSGGNNNGYGNACAADSQSGSITGSATRLSYGAFAYSGGNYYSDDYYYSPCGSSYGNGQNGYLGYGASGGCSAGSRGAIWIQYLNDY